MVRRAIAAGVILGALVLPSIGAGAQEATSTSTMSDVGVPYLRVDDGADDPYRPLWFEEAGQTLSPLDPEIVQAADDDDAHLLFASPTDLGGFQTAPVGGSLWQAQGVLLTGVAAPPVPEGSGIADVTSPTSERTSTTLADVETAIPQLGGTESTGRTSFAFTDDGGSPAPPPGDLPPVADPPAPPTEGIDAAPTTTTTAPSSPATTASTTPPAPPSTTTTTGAPPPTTATTAPATTTTAAPPTSTTTSTPDTTTTTRPPTTTTTTRPPTTTTTRPPTTTTTTRPPTTTTTRPPTTTTSTSTAPTTTTTTTPPPIDAFSLSQERPSATTCVAGSGESASCDALWSVPLAATGETHTFDLTLRNSGNVDASALQVWASSACVTTSTATPAGSGDLCAAVELTIQRYTTSTRGVPLECVYGGGTAQVCSLSSARTLAAFSATHPSSAQARAIGTGLQEGEAAHLRVTLRLPDVDNSYQRRTATLSLTWRQVQ
jgi:hypothetical protein